MFGLSILLYAGLFKRIQTGLNIETNGHNIRHLLGKCSYEAGYTDERAMVCF